MTQAQPTSVTPRSSSLPSVLDADAWAALPDPIAIAAAVGEVLALVEPGADGDRVQALGRAVASRGYTAAEVQLIKAEAPFRNHYGAFMRLDVLDAIVTESRRLRSMLSRRVTDEERAEISTKHPEVLFNDFVPAGYDSKGAGYWWHDPVRAARLREVESEDLSRPGTPDGPKGWREAAEAEAERVRAGMPVHVNRRRSAGDGTSSAAAAARAALIALGAPDSVLASVEDAVRDVEPAPVPPVAPAIAGARAAISRAQTPEEIARILDGIVPAPQPTA